MGGMKTALFDLFRHCELCRRCYEQFVRYASTRHLDGEPFVLVSREIPHASFVLVRKTDETIAIGKNIYRSARDYDNSHSVPCFRDKANKNCAVLHAGIRAELVRRDPTIPDQLSLWLASSC